MAGRETMYLISRRFSLAAAAVLAGTVPALAHAHLTTATPAPNGTVTAAPSELDLTFSEGLNIKFSGVAFLGPDGKAVTTGPGALSAGGGTILQVPLTTPLSAGTYRVTWHALSKDGHKTTGTYSFTIKP